MACNVLIYDDTGVSKVSYDWTVSFFENRGCVVSKVDTSDLHSRNWMTDTDIVVIPGGADCPYHSKLTGSGCSNIKDFVARGGFYVGICAGGYFGCKRVEFAVGTDLEVCEDRELAFFQGIASGPMLKPYVYDSESGASAARVTSSVGMFYAYHNGGCTFALDNSNSKSIEVLASYIDAENQPAMILCSYGKGKAILSGIHFEADQLLLRNTTSDEKAVLDSIASDVELTADIRKKFLDYIF